MQFSIALLHLNAPVLAIFISAMAAGPLYAQTSVGNPWVEPSKPLMDKKTSAVESNSWRAKDDAISRDGYDKSKYPPLDENTALGIAYLGSPPSNTVTGHAWRYPRNGENFSPQIPNYEQVPVYGRYSRDDYPAYGYRQAPAYQWNHQPEYPGRYGPGSNSRGGFPFFGNSSSGFPFSMGDGMMPFSGQGFW